jgi:hypothetical protein
MPISLDGLKWEDGDRWGMNRDIEGVYIVFSLAGSQVPVITDVSLEELEQPGHIHQNNYHHVSVDSNGRLLGHMHC